MKQEVTAKDAEDLAITALYESAAPALFAYARSRLSSPEEAEDLLVEVFLAALESSVFPTLSTDKQFAWLRRVAQHKIIDSYRHRAHLPTVTMEQVEKTLNLAGSSTPEQRTLRQEELQRLQAALQRLPPLQQQVLFLHFVDELRCIEIAHILGKRDGTVRVLLARALNRLREIYSQ